MSAAVAGAMDNSDQSAFWNGAGGEKWLSQADRLEPGLAPFGEAAMAAARPRPGERVIDLGCGPGSTSAALARQVGESGAVLGVDISHPLIAAARQRHEALANLSFVVADATAHPFEAATYDLLFSRFGSMFFADPVAGFSHLRGALKPGGRFALVCWREFKANGWAFIPFMAGVPHLPPIERPAPNAPGPFAFADPKRVRGIFAAAGFADTDARAIDREMVLSQGDFERAVTFATDMGPLSRVLADADAPVRQRVRAAVAEKLRSFAAPDGSVSLPAACWIYTGRNGG